MCQNLSKFILFNSQRFMIPDNLTMINESNKTNQSSDAQKQQQPPKESQAKTGLSAKQKQRKIFNDLFGLAPNNKPISQLPSNLANSNKAPLPNRIEATGNTNLSLFGTAPIKNTSTPFANLFGLPTVNDSKYLQTISFEDGEKIPQKTQTLQPLITKQLGNRIELSLKSQNSELKLNKDIILPCLCSIKAINESRASVDIICVIDVSGSMRGEKIALVKDALKYVVQMLTKKDRLSIVIYQNSGKRLCPLLFVNQENKIKFSSIINGIDAFGGNIMVNGLEVAVKILRERRTKNEVTSVFLLSDGQEPVGTDQKFKTMLEKKQNENIGSFSLHSFGFGKDHDEKLMTKMCSLKDGNFYFINKLSSLDQAFCNALGGVLTQAASNLEITINCAEGIMEGAFISKVHGDKWKKIDQKTYKIQINQIMSEVSKDFAFQVHIPKNQFQTFENIQIVKGTFSAIDKQGNKLQGEASLKITVLQQNCQKDIQANSEVIENYLRINAVQKIQESIGLAEQGKYEQSKKKMQEVIETTKTRPNIKEENVKGIIENLQKAKQKFTNNNLFGNEGKKELVDMCYSNSNKTSFQYSNEYQKQMLFSLQESKARKQK